MGGLCFCQAGHCRHSVAVGSRWIHCQQLVFGEALGALMSECGWHWPPLRHCKVVVRCRGM